MCCRSRSGRYEDLRLVAQRATKTFFILRRRGHEAQRGRRHFVFARMHPDEISRQGIEIGQAALERSAGDVEARARLLGRVAGADEHEIRYVEEAPREGDEADGDSRGPEDEF